MILIGNYNALCKTQTIKYNNKLPVAMLLLALAPAYTLADSSVDALQNSPKFVLENIDLIRFVGDSSVDAVENSPKFVLENIDLIRFVGDSSVDALENSPNNVIGIIETAIISRQQFANYINSSGRYIDRFISQKILRQSENDFSKSGARARLSWDNAYIDKLGYKSSVDFNINLDLNQSQRHLRLVFNSNHQQQNDENNLVTNNKNPTEDREFYTGLQYLWKTYKKWQPSLKAAARWHGAKPEPFATFSMTRSFGKNNHNWLLEPSISYYHKSYTHYDFNANYYQKISRDWSLRFENNVHFLRKTNNFSYAHSPSIQLEINSKTSWQNQLIISGNNQQATFYQQAILRSLLSSTVYRDWLVLELEPRLTIDLQRHSKLRQQPAIYLRAHVLFNR